MDARASWWYLLADHGILRAARGAGAALLILMMTAVAVRADGIESVELQHRSASAVIDQVRALVGDDATLIADGHSILVRGDADAVSAVRSAVEQLDRPAVPVRVTLRAGTPTDMARAGVAPQRDGVRTYGTRTRSQDDSEQVITGHSGEPMQIRASEEQGRTRRQLLLGGDRPGYAEEREYVTAERGFFVRPDVQGERVTLTLAATRQAFERDGERRGQDVTTSVSGGTGEWLLVGSSGQAEQTEERGRRYTTRRSEEGIQWWIRVDRLDQ
ncbi:secretin N-terminal domain-containing protein [Aquisalimonas sp.]|uniref:secretin N-terminal domain-containing protein n=1 Tax=unclassified Aquisalimonas TaxID=2644645 RepID=UPI0025C296D6|nr:secretin N-terminal domain-containing protein [Aquisalimonas sp.]